MTENKYWSLKPFYSSLIPTSNEKKLVNFITLVCQTKIISLFNIF